ncbi:MAG TPA: hypothetical protein VHU40_19920 [Polyangia bacterium]|nr:hypothetical protein [Polyangia bacterium]
MITALGASARAGVVRLSPQPPPKALSSPTLDFAELYVFGPRAPRVTDKTEALHGKRVTMVGFMVALQRPVLGGFFMSPYPADADESGGGRGDLPPTAVLVLPKAAAGHEVAFLAGALEITGILDVGNQVQDGEPSTIRLLVEDARSIRFARTRRTAKTSRTTTTAKQEGRGPR